MRLVLAPPEGVLVEELHAPDGQGRHLGDLREHLVRAAANALEVLDAQGRLRAAFFARLGGGDLGEIYLACVVPPVRRSIRLARRLLKPAPLF